MIITYTVASGKRAFFNTVDPGFGMTTTVFDFMRLLP